MDNKNKNIEDEISFREVFRQPIRWFGYMYVLILVLVLALGYFFIKNMDTMFFNEVPPLPADTSNVPKDITPQKGANTAGVNVNDILQPSQQLISKGRQLFETNCSSCHGATGMGDGPAGQVLNPKPRNFHSKEGWKNGMSFPAMYKTVQEGIPNTGMSSFSYLAPSDRVAIIQFIRSLTSNFPLVTKNEVQELDKTYNLAAGQKAASQIPIKTAMERVSNDAGTRIQKVYSILEKIQKNPADSASAIFDRAAKNKFEAIYNLSENDKWQGSFDDFVKTITSSINYNGFNTSVLKMSRSDLQILHGYLTRMFAV